MFSVGVFILHEGGSSNPNWNNRLRSPWACADAYFAHAFSRTLDGGSERMKSQNPISQKEMGFSFFRAKNEEKNLKKMIMGEIKTLLGRSS
jgi:hypothetical protein